MATAFRAVSGIVAEVVVYPDAARLSDCFHPELGFRAVPAGTAVAVGMTWDGSALGPAPAPPPPTTADLSARARSAWSAVLAAGQTFQVAPQGSAPVEVLCDGTNPTRADLALLALYGQANPAGSKTWLDNMGRTTVLTGAELVTLATLAGNWVADTYPALATLLGQIASGLVTTFAEVDAYAWPSA